VQSEDLQSSFKKQAPVVKTRAKTQPAAKIAAYHVAKNVSKTEAKTQSKRQPKRSQSCRQGGSRKEAKVVGKEAAENKPKL